MVKVSRARAFTVRVQLSKSEQDQWLPKIKADVAMDPLRFEELVIGGPELAPTTGMRHVHIYVAFEHARSMSQIPALLQLRSFKPWIECAVKHNRERIINHHCKLATKEDANVLKLYQFPEQIDNGYSTDDTRSLKKQRTTGNDLRQAIETGNIETVKELNYMLYIKSKGAIEAECARFRQETNDCVYEHLWIVGDTGKGKTAYIKRTWPDAYWKDCCNSNFEEYNGQNVVVLDDFDNKRLRLMTVGKLKNLCNPAGDRCKVNYGTVHVKARIIVTSQYSLKDCFKHKGKKQMVVNPDWAVPEDPIEDDPDYQAIKRRFTEVTIDKLLFQANLQLKSKTAIRALTPEQQAAYDVFEPYDPEHNREIDCYSECNQSLRSYRTQSTQTTDESDVQESTKTITTTVDKSTEYIRCTLKSCSHEGYWVEGIHIHRKMY